MKYLAVLCLVFAAGAVNAQSLNNANSWDNVSATGGTQHVSPAFSNTTIAKDLFFTCQGADPTATQGDITTTPVMSDSTVLSVNGDITSGSGNNHQKCWDNLSLAGGTTPTINYHTTSAATGPTTSYAGAYYLDITGAGPWARDCLATSYLNASSLTSLTGPTCVTTRAHEVVICIATQVHGTGGAFASAGSGWTGVAFGSQGIEYKIGQSAGTQSCTMTANAGTNDYTFVLASYYATANRVSGNQCNSTPGAATSKACTITLSGVATTDIMPWGANSNNGATGAVVVTNSCGATNHNDVGNGLSDGSASWYGQGYLTGGSGSCVLTFTATTFSSGAVAEDDQNLSALDVRAIDLNNGGTTGATRATSSITTHGSDYIFIDAADQAAQEHGVPTLSSGTVGDNNTLYPTTDGGFNQSSAGSFTTTWGNYGTSSVIATGVMAFTQLSTGGGVPMMGGL